MPLLINFFLFSFLSIYLIHFCFSISWIITRSMFSEGSGDIFFFWMMRKHEITVIPGWFEVLIFLILWQYWFFHRLFRFFFFLLSWSLYLLLGVASDDEFFLVHWDAKMLHWCWSFFELGRSEATTFLLCHCLYAMKLNICFSSNLLFLCVWELSFSLHMGMDDFHGLWRILNKFGFLILVEIMWVMKPLYISYPCLMLWCWWLMIWHTLGLIPNGSTSFECFKIALEPIIH